MKTRIANIKLGLAAIALVAMWLASPAIANNRPQVCGPPFFGKNLADWEELYWRWTYGDVAIAPDANGNAVAAGNVVLMPLPNVPGDGTPGNIDVTLDAKQSFFMPLFGLLGTSYTDGVTPPDPFVNLSVFRTLNLKFTIDGRTIVDGRNQMNLFSKFAFAPPIPINDFGIDSIIWFEGMGTLLPPLRPGKHVLKLDAKNTQPAFGTTFEYHNTFNVTVLPEDLGNRNIFPPDSRPYGKTYEEWSAKWWKWAMTLPPVAGHPFIDDPAFDVTLGQSGNVWFLAAPFDTVERTCTVPLGKALFVGLLNGEASDLEGLGATEAERRETAKFLADHIVGLFCTIDGKPVHNITHYRASSPQFTFTAPTPWIFGTTGGAGKSVADGYYLMVEPLSKGNHTIHFGGAFHFDAGELGPDPVDLPLDMTCHLTVSPNCPGAWR